MKIYLVVSKTPYEDDFKIHSIHKTKQSAEKAEKEIKGESRIYIDPNVWVEKMITED